MGWRQSLEGPGASPPGITDEDTSNGAANWFSGKECLASKMLFGPHKHAKIQAICLGGDPNSPVLPENMTLDELRDSIMADLEWLRETGVLDLPRLPQGVVANSNADSPRNGGSSDQAE